MKDKTKWAQEYSKLLQDNLEPNHKFIQEFNNDVRRNNVMQEHFKRMRNVTQLKRSHP